MDCRAASDLVHRYIDREVGDATAAEVERHVAECPACRNLYLEQQALQGAIRRHATRHAAPRDLAMRVGVVIDEARPATSAAPSWSWRQMGFAASILLAVGASSGATWFLTAPNRERPLAQEVVASHVRSLMADHLTDIASSDTHTVKPWFNGRIDVAPPVRDLTAQGFPLIGGRLDYLDRRPVVALVYRRSRHVINLFIWPVDRDAPSRLAVPASLNGFNMRQWDDGSMRFWAVSDLNAADLATFERIVRAPP